ncbi:hypothetical protein C1N53_09390 [Pontibacter sp. SGAir0037]|nr:hypothetical protein C1N53_09390 [Pontibacter sp. SGAir0037]
MAHPERKRNRLSGYDYSSEGLYFVTSCVQDRVHAFGKVIVGKMRLNKYGLIPLLARACSSCLFVTK